MNNYVNRKFLKQREGGGGGGGNSVQRSFFTGYSTQFYVNFNKS